MARAVTVLTPPGTGRLWLTSDTHFNHFKVIEYCNRPFSSLEEMNDILTARWNEKVQPEDTVYHCGDFSFGNFERMLETRKQLNGTIVLIRGNHDRFTNAKGEALGLNVAGTIVDLNLNGTVFRMTHRPPTQELMLPGAHHLCGHVHDRWKARDGVLNVGVDQWDFYPLSFEDAVQALLSEEVSL